MDEKQSVQNFQWDGSAPRIEGTHVWFRSIDGSEHGWPQLTETEAMRLALFLHGSLQRAASVRVVQVLGTNSHPISPLDWDTPGLGYISLRPGQSIAIIDRRDEAATSGVKDGHVRLPDGREVKVLGTLPMTVDGAIIGAGADVRVFWSRDDLADKEWEGWPVASVGAGHSESNHFIWADLCGNGPVATNVLYSTREAAEAAAGEGEKP